MELRHVWMSLVCCACGARSAALPDRADRNGGPEPIIPCHVDDECAASDPCVAGACVEGRCERTPRPFSIASIDEALPSPYQPVRLGEEVYGLFEFAPTRIRPISVDGWAGPERLFAGGEVRFSVWTHHAYAGVGVDDIARMDATASGWTISLASDPERVNLLAQYPEAVFPRFQWTGTHLLAVLTEWRGCPVAWANERGEWVTEASVVPDACPWSYAFTTGVPPSLLPVWIGEQGEAVFLTIDSEAEGIKYTAYPDGRHALEPFSLARSGPHYFGPLQSLRAGGVVGAMVFRFNEDEAPGQVDFGILEDLYWVGEPLSATTAGNPERRVALGWCSERFLGVWSDEDGTVLWQMDARGREVAPPTRFAGSSTAFSYFECLPGGAVLSQRSTLTRLACAVDG